MAWVGGASPRLVVVGAGVAGLTAAHAALDAMPGLQVHVLERTGRAGGLVETERTADGFVIDHGADGFVTTKPAGLQVARRVGLGGALTSGGDGPRAAFLVRKDRLVRLPPGVAFGIPATAADMLLSPVLSLAAKVRMAFEPLVRRRIADEDESVAAFIERRFGHELLERIIEPLLGGIHGTPATELSVRACLPRLYELERVHGSVVRGIRSGEASAGGPSTGSGVMSLREGMESLPRALAHSLGDRLHFGKDVLHITARDRGGYRLHLRDGNLLDADAVVLAAPAHAAAHMVDTLSPALAKLLGGVRHRPVTCVSFGWGRADVPHPLEGTGFVVPGRENRATRACTWASAKWPGRAPTGAVLVRSVLNAHEADDVEAVEAARSDLRDLMGIEAAPIMTRVRRRQRALPMYEVGYLDRLESMRAESASLGAFALAGNAQGGIGIPDCIDSGREAALTALARLA
jgi:protoporphyrinogen/coproporphyrinogen III oxidase